MRKTASQLAVEEFAQVWGVDVSVVWRLARALKEALGPDGARLGLWLVHQKGGGGDLAPGAQQLLNLILARVASEPAKAVETVLLLRSLITGNSFIVVTQMRTETLSEKRNALLSAGTTIPEEFEVTRTGPFSYFQDVPSLALEGSTLAEWAETEVESLSLLPEQELQEWAERSKLDRIEFDLGRRTARFSFVRGWADGSRRTLTQLFVDPQASLLATDDENGEERLVRFPLGYLGVAARLLAQSRGKRRKAQDLPPTGSVSPTEPRNENASDLAGSEAPTRTDGRRRKTDTGSTTHNPDNRTAIAISQSCLSVSRAIRGQPASEARAA